MRSHKKHNYVHVHDTAPQLKYSVHPQNARGVPYLIMSFARLQHCQIDDVFVFLGPDCFQLRRTCILAREKSNGVDMLLEILRWHCVNSALLEGNLHCLECLGRIPLRCSICDKRTNTRQMFRYTRSRSRVDGHREGMLYMCCLCAFDDARRFLAAAPKCFIFQGGDDCRSQARLLVAIGVSMTTLD